MTIVRRNLSLKKYNTFAIDVKAKYFVEFNSTSELKEILNTKVYKNNKNFILGGGSNILPLEDFDGLILLNRIKGISMVRETDSHMIIEVGAGENWHKFVEWTIKQNLSGVENLALIPGKVGASPIQNIGAYGMEVKDTITRVHTLNTSDQDIKIFNNQDCRFSYRSSIFKTELKNKFIILKVEFKLYKKPLNKIEYGAIAQELESLQIDASPKNIAHAVVNIRNRKLPNPNELPNSGSFFKNPIISTKEFRLLQKKFPDIIGYKISNFKTKVAAGWLIEKAGLKGYRCGDAGVHKNQALVLVNHGKASGKEILTLAKEIQNTILDKYGILIEPEVNFL